MKELTEKELYHYGRKVVQSLLEHEVELGCDWDINEQDIKFQEKPGRVEFECHDKMHGNTVYLRVSNIELDDDLDDGEFFECATVEAEVNGDIDHYEEISPYSPSIKYLYIALRGG